MLLWSLVLIVTVINVALYMLQPRMVFHPVKALQSTPAQWGMDFESVHFQTEDNKQLHGWYLPAANARKVLLFFHGNAGNISHRHETLAVFHALGMNVFIFDYRGYGNSQGQPSELGLYHDALAAWRYLTATRGIAAEDIVIAGRSLGAAVAANLASQVKAGGVILESTFSSIRDLSHEMFPFIAYILVPRFSFNTRQAVKSVTSPLLIVHSTEDEFFRIENSRRIYEAANPPKDILVINGSHNSGFLQSAEQYNRRLRKFFASLP